MINIIKDFVEGKLDAPSFFNTLYTSDEMESAFMAETNMPSWTNATTLYYYLISGDMSDTFIRNAKNLLGQYLIKNGVSFFQDKQDEINQDMVLKALPDWLDLETEYFEEILKNHDLTKSEKMDAIKRKITSEFKYLFYPPRWLQAPEWPFYNNTPLIFVGELEESEEPGRARVYVFFCKDSGTYTCINQTD